MVCRHVLDVLLEPEEAEALPDPSTADEFVDLDYLLPSESEQGSQADAIGGLQAAGLVHCAVSDAAPCCAGGRTSYRLSKFALKEAQVCRLAPCS